MKISINRLAFAAAAIFLGVTAFPTQANKNAGGLRLSMPVESPAGVHFSWTGGQTNTVYGIYRRMQGDANWERIQMNLTGVSGSVDVDGFSLDHTYEYKIQAEEQ